VPAVESADFETLNKHDCFELLSSAWLGRVGISADALPAILPVAYVVDGSSVVFRTSAGSKLDAVGEGQVICFEVDHADRDLRTGWSVLVIGRAQEVTDPNELARIDDLGIERWSSPTADHYVRLPADVISGRRTGMPVSTSC
jgi:nitroimidazol reductase NimA-like FMN-containing flavoprotein (pyridoxamine 5'-phosphate oxidase superfamily)